MGKQWLPNDDVAKLNTRTSFVGGLTGKINDRASTLPVTPPAPKKNLPEPLAAEPPIIGSVKPLVARRRPPKKPITYTALTGSKG